MLILPWLSALVYHPSPYWTPGKATGRTANARGWRSAFKAKSDGGSLPIRAGKQFLASRKLGKTHQNVLVFVKGDPKKATQACGTVEIFEQQVDEVRTDG